MENADGDGFQPRFAAAPKLSHQQHGGSLQAGDREASWVKTKRNVRDEGSVARSLAQSFVITKEKTRYENCFITVFELHYN